MVLSPRKVELWDPTYNQFSGAHLVHLDFHNDKRLPGHAPPPSPYQDANGGPAWQQLPGRFPQVVVGFRYPPYTLGTLKMIRKNVVLPQPRSGIP